MNCPMASLIQIPWQTFPALHIASSCMFVLLPSYFMQIWQCTAMHFDAQQHNLLWSAIYIIGNQCNKPLTKFQYLEYFTPGQVVVFACFCSNKQGDGIGKVQSNRRCNFSFSGKISHRSRLNWHFSGCLRILVLIISTSVSLFHGPFISPSLFTLPGNPTLLRTRITQPVPPYAGDVADGRR